MSFINHNAKVIHLKVVYYGPSLSGKTTNVRWIFQQTGADDAQLNELNTDVERTFFFDFLPLGIGEIRGYQTRFHLFTVPGQVVYDASRRFIMKGLDGVVFVADSQKERMEENLQSLKNLEKNLEQQGYDIREIPLVMQYNKRDLPNIASMTEMRNLLNPFNAPEIEACASRGTGVLESLKTVSKSIVHVLKGGALI